MALSPARRVPWWLVGPVLVRTGHGRAWTPFGAFARDEAPPVALLDGYRDTVKSAWRLYWEPTRRLLELERERRLPAELARLATTLRASRTLPVDLDELTTALKSFVDADLPAVAATPMAAVERAERYLRSAREMVVDLEPHGFSIGGARTLDVGCASGYLTFAVAAIGAALSVGIDVDPVGYVRPHERVATRDAILGATDAEVRLEEGDAMALPYGDGAFDLVYSTNVLEHVQDLRGAFREMRRVLAPGGFAHHRVDPWFGPRGGHSLATLDFPWGHVRTTDDEFARYVNDLRPFEAPSALHDRLHAFQRPPLTLRESLEAARDAGFELVGWSELPVPMRDPHRALLTRELVADARRLHPAVTPRDLLCIDYKIVLRRQ